MAGLHRSWFVAFALGWTAGCAADEGKDTAVGDPCMLDEDCGEELICQGQACAVAQCEVSDDCPGAGATCADGRCVEPYWVVGEDGLVVRADVAGRAEVHPVPVTGDLNAIACHGRDRAWAVGDGGTMLVTDDGGASFELLPLDTTADLVGVAVGEGRRVAAVGEGVALVADDGRSFMVYADVPGTLRGVVVRGDGVMAVGEDGLVWRLDGTGSASRKLDAPDLLGVGGHHDEVVVVGRGGAVLWSSDGGVSFDPLATGVTADLYAVQVASHEPRAIAVGDRGTVLLLTPTETTTVEAPDLELRAAHLGAEGLGAAVSREGVVLLTRDFGRSFEPIVDLGRPLSGVDSIGDAHW